MTRPSGSRSEFSGSVFDLDEIADQQLDVAIDFSGLHTVEQLGHEDPD